MTEARAGRVLVLGLGNPLMGDDGIGLAALARLAEQWVLPAAVEAVDGGTWGMNLLPIIEDADRVLIIDAIRLGAASGTVHELTRDQLPRFFAHKLSPHQIDLKEILALLELRGTFPSEMVAVGLEPAVVALGTELSPAVEGGLEDLVQRVVDRLAAWGHRPVAARPSRAATVSEHPAA